MVTFTEEFLNEAVAVLRPTDGAAVGAGRGDRRRPGGGGRLFILGVGGSAGHASHAVNDFRKICGMEAYAPTDNVSELTARTNDDGWDTTFSAGCKAPGSAERGRGAGVLGGGR